MKAARAIAVIALGFSVAPAAAGPTFSTGGSCASDAASRVPSAARMVLLSNPSNLHLAASLYRRIDKPNFKYVDADGGERRSDFPYFYQVYIPPHGTAPIGCTRLYVADGEAAQNFVLQATDYFLKAPSDMSEDAKPYAGFIVGGATRWHLINLNPTKTLHVTTAGESGAPMRFDLLPQAVSTAAVGTSAEVTGKPPSPRPVVTEAHF